MRSMSFSDSCCFISISIYSSACSISLVKSCSCGGSPGLPDTNCFDESTTCMSAVSSIYTSHSPCCTCSCCTFFSYSFRSCYFNSCKSFYVSSILHFSLYLCCFSCRVVAFFPLLQKMFSELAPFLFLNSINNLPLALLHTNMFASIAATSGALWDATSRCFNIHSTARPNGSLSLEEL